MEYFVHDLTLFLFAFFCFLKQQSWILNLSIKKRKRKNLSICYISLTHREIFKLWKFHSYEIFMLWKFPTNFSSYEIWEGTCLFCLSHLDLPNHDGPCQTLWYHWNAPWWVLCPELVSLIFNTWWRSYWILNNLFFCWKLI